jgi:hypothetical protein
VATLAELRDKILSKLDDGDIQRPSASQVAAQINSTIKFYENKPFWFTQEKITLTTTAGSRVLTGVPDDFKQTREPNALVIIQNDMPYPLQHITPLAYDTYDVGAQGIPTLYTYRDGEFQLYYIPDQEYDINLYYEKRFDDLVDDADTNGFTLYAERLIEYRTLADLLADYREDFERANLYFQRADEEKKQILTETYKRTSTGNLSTECIVDDNIINT